MNRLIQMAGLVPAILSVLCACQHPAPQAAGTGQDLKAIYANLPFSMPVVERPVFRFRSEERWCDAEHGSDK